MRSLLITGLVPVVGAAELCRVCVSYLDELLCSVLGRNWVVLLWVLTASRRVAMGRRRSRAMSLSLSLRYVKLWARRELQPV